MGTPPAGCAETDPCTSSIAPSAAPPGVRGKLLRGAGRHLFVQSPALIGHLLGETEQTLALGRLDRRQRPEPELALAVISQRHSWPGLVEEERIAARRAHHRVIAEQRPVTAGHRAILLVQTRAQVVAVRHAVAVSDDQRGSV